MINGYFIANPIKAKFSMYSFLIRLGHLPTIIKFKGSINIANKVI